MKQRNKPIENANQTVRQILSLYQEESQRLCAMFRKYEGQQWYQERLEHFRLKLSRLDALIDLYFCLLTESYVKNLQYFESKKKR